MLINLSLQYIYFSPLCKRKLQAYERMNIKLFNRYVIGLPYRHNLCTRLHCFYRQQIYTNQQASDIPRLHLQTPCGVTL